MAPAPKKEIVLGPPEEGAVFQSREEAMAAAMGAMSLEKAMMVRDKEAEEGQADREKRMQKMNKRMQKRAAKVSPLGIIM